MQPKSPSYFAAYQSLKLNVIINTGTRALEPMPGLIDAHPLTHIEALEALRNLLEDERMS